MDCSLHLTEAELASMADDESISSIFKPTRPGSRGRPGPNYKNPLPPIVTLSPYELANLLTPSPEETVINPNATDFSVEMKKSVKDYG